MEAGWSTSTHDADHPVFLLAAFAKNEKANLSKAERNALAKFVKTLLNQREEHDE